ncbi:UNVERIFIED_CONTAM: hypothetical protein NCL1_59202 [Trichonephila clavipes]
MFWDESRKVRVEDYVRFCVNKLMGIDGFELMVLWRSRLIIWKLQISLVSVIEVQDMNDLEVKAFLND